MPEQATKTTAKWTCERMKNESKTTDHERLQCARDEHDWYPSRRAILFWILCVAMIHTANVIRASAAPRVYLRVF